MPRQSTKFLGVTVLTLLCALAFARPSAGGGTPAQQCEANKLKASGKKVACRLTAMAKIATGGTADLTKCSAKFPDAFTKAETKAGVGVCPTEGDASAIENTIDADTNTLQARLGGVRFVDNGDGTVTDNQTGLQWEKKTNVDGFSNLADPHDADNGYTWTAMALGTPPNGAVFTDFLDKLNGGLGANTCFAGRCDWRLPTVEELQTILLDPYSCGTSPCIAPVFGPTVPGRYWSASTMATDPMGASRVDFFDGYVDYGSKDQGRQVRAVRSGL